MVILPKKFREPVIADRTVDLMSASVWFCLAAWGISSAITGLGTIEDAIGDPALKLWGGAIGSLAAVAFIAAFTTFFRSRSVQTRILRKSVEMVAVSMMAGLISLYPIFVGLAVIGGDWARFSVFWVALTYLALPTWRVRHLFIRIRALKNITKSPTIVVIP